MELTMEVQRQFATLAGFKQGDCLSDIIHNDLARVTPSHMTLKLLANGRINRTVNVLVELFKQLFALHASPKVLSRFAGKSYN